MNAEVLSEPSPTIADAESWLALGTGALLLLVGTSRRSLAGACLAASSAPLLYRGITGRWPRVLNGSDQPGSGVSWQDENVQLSQVQSSPSQAQRSPT